MKLKNIILILALNATLWCEQMKSIPTSAAVITTKNGNKVIIIGDTHFSPHATTLIAKEKPYVQSLTRYIADLHKQKTPTRFVIELNTSDIENWDSISHTPQCLDSLCSFVIKETKKISDREFQHGSITFEAADSRDAELYTLMLSIITSGHAFITNELTSHTIEQFKKIYPHPLPQFFSDAKKLYQQLKKQVESLNLPKDAYAVCQKHMHDIEYLFSLWEKTEGSPKDASNDRYHIDTSSLAKVICLLKCDPEWQTKSALTLVMGFKKRMDSFMAGGLRCFNAIRTLAHNCLLPIIGSLGDLACICTLFNYSKEYHRTVAYVGTNHLIRTVSFFKTLEGVTVETWGNLDHTSIIAENKVIPLSMDSLQTALNATFSQESQEAKESKEQKDSKENLLRSENFVGQGTTTTGTTTQAQQQQVQQTQTCAQCNKNNAPKQCGRCKVAKYCSATCQQNHWAQHKQQCHVKVTTAR